MSKIYLGDGVYADRVDGMIKLTTEDGLNVHATIYLEPEVYLALVDWVESLKKQRA